METDYAAIESLVKRMYAVFSNRDGRVPNLNELYDLYIPQGLIIKSVGDATEIYNLAEFIAPRIKILTDGTLTEFEEWRPMVRRRYSGRSLSGSVAIQKKVSFPGYHSKPMA